MVRWYVSTKSGDYFLTRKFFNTIFLTHTFSWKFDFLGIFGVLKIFCVKKFRTKKNRVKIMVPTKTTN